MDGDGVVGLSKRQCLVQASTPEAEPKTRRGRSIPRGSYCRHRHKYVVAERCPMLHLLGPTTLKNLLLLGI